MWIKRILSLSASLLVFNILTGCDQSALNSSGISSDEQGDVVIGLTDAPGDFTTYTVDVTSLRLQRANGSLVETLPINTRVDFAQYVELTEFFTTATVPSGRYVKGEITLDYTDADIQVEGEQGNSVPVTTLVDEDGKPVDQLVMSVNLENTDHLIIARGIPAHLTLDFDLNASHTVDLTQSDNPVVTVEPVLLAEVSREKSKSHRARGGLKSVDLGDSHYTVVLRPFHHRFNKAHDFGELQISTNEETLFEINGEDFVGIDGLRVLSEEPTLTATIALGHFKHDPIRFVANSVYAGSSVPGGDKDVVRGSVIAREGNTLRVKGATLIRQQGRAVFNDIVTVTLNENTRVKKQTSSEEFSIGDISVGQRVSIFGELSDDNAENPILDASNGTVRMLVTYLNAGVLENGSDLVLDLSRINGRVVTQYSFLGTGSTPDFDADPNNYEVDSGQLTLENIGAQSAVKVAGFVQAFGTAPVDFTAQTVMDVSNLPATLKVGWNPAQADALDTSSGNSIVIDLNGVGRFHHVSQAGVRIDLTALQTQTEIVAQEDAVFGIIEKSSRQVFAEFEGFIVELERRIAAGSAVRSIVAPGLYINDSNSMEAKRITVRLR